MITKSVKRTRIGLLVPSSNSIMENDLHSALDRAQYSVHTARMYLVETLRQAEQNMIDEFAPKAASDLATVRPDFVIFGCTSGASLGGPEGDREICKSLGRLAGCETISALHAINESLKTKTFQRLAVITPYVDDLTASVASATETPTRKLVGAFGMGIAVNDQLADPTPKEIIEFAVAKLQGLDFDGVLIPCTNFRALEAKAALEETFGVPVVTSNSAIIESIESRFAA